MKNIIKRALGVALAAVVTVSCNYLDVVPDNIPTIDHAFASEMEARKYLATLYSFLPNHNSKSGNIGLTGSDEITSRQILTGSNEITPMRIVRGEQNRNEPILSFWDTNYRAIRECNIFIENVIDEGKIHDLMPEDRRRWLGEAYFLKAYYHFYLLRMYGPIVLVRENINVDAPVETVRVKREPFDVCVEYIAELLDMAAERLPNEIVNKAEELGRVTRPAALALKARLLVTAASPLFNGNPDYASFKNKDGELLFNSVVVPEKWEAAAAACSLAVASCDESGLKLFEYTINEYNVSDVTKRKLSINNSVTVRWTSELIWGFSARNADGLQADCMARVDPKDLTNIQGGRDLMNPTIEITDNYYTRNGVPISEDKTWNYNGRYELRTAVESEKYDLIKDYTINEMHFDREPRFYAHLAFDGSIWYLVNGPNDNTDESTWTVKARSGGGQARLGAYNYSVTGYWCKKLVNYKFRLITSGSGYSAERYPWPEIRVADLYLLYAEALNESGHADEAIEWLDKVRERAGLPGVEEAWTDFSITPNKYKTQDGLRSIIRQERTNELMFEGHRFWDMRRWQLAEKQLNNKTLSGWAIDQESPEGYYNKQPLFNQRFIAPRDYLWPLSENSLIVNPNLVQNPGW